METSITNILTTYSKEIVMLFSTLVIIIGWFVNAYFTRKHETAKQKLDYRLKMMSTSIPTLLKIRKTEGNQVKLTQIENEITNLHSNFQIYANKSELTLLKKFTEGDISKINDLIILLRNTIRKELDLEDFKL